MITFLIGKPVLIPKINCTSYLKLPNNFYETIAPTPISNPELILFNHELVSFFEASNITSYDVKKVIATCAGNYVPNHLKSIALAYAGHQFGYFVPILGDGRAVLLGEIKSNNGTVWDIQLKGAGKTAFSRTGDGRAPLSAVLREYLISEAMYALKIPTTRCLAVIASDERIYRPEGLVPLGVLTRISASSLRVGSFEFAADQKNKLLLNELADYAIARHFPALILQEDPYIELFKEVVERQASLIAEWMGVGFIHGVMNTDNMTISGETIDYGPCAFMDEFDFATCFSSVDFMGRYAFGNQASIAYWNLASLRHSLLPLFKDTDKRASDKLQEVLDSFTQSFHYYWDKKIRAKLGLLEENARTIKLIKQFFILMQQHQPDFTNTFRILSKAIDSRSQQKSLIHMLGNQEQSKQWVTDWVAYVTQQDISIENVKITMNQVNPAYIPRNHLIDQAIQSFIENDDRNLMDTLLSVLRTPYQQQNNTEKLQSVPLLHERVLKTFCGT